MKKRSPFPCLPLRVCLCAVAFLTSPLAAQHDHGHAGHDHSRAEHGHAEQETRAPVLVGYIGPTEETQNSPAHTDFLADKQMELRPPVLMPVAAVLDLAHGELVHHELDVVESHYRGAMLETWLLFGSLELTEGNFQAARDALWEANRVLGPGKRLTRISLALAQLWNGESEEGAKTLREAANQRERDYVTRMYALHADILRGDMDAAQSEIDALRDLLPEQIAGIEEALERTAGDPEARRSAFLPRLNVGRIAQMDDEERAVLRAQLLKTQKRILLNLAVLADLDGRPERAATFRSQASTRKPAREVEFRMIDLGDEPLPPLVQPLDTESQAFWNAATIEYLPVLKKIDAGDVAAAQKELAEMQKDEPTAVGKALTALFHARGERLDEAEKLLREALAEEPSTKTEIEIHLARLLLQQNRSDDALEVLRAAQEGALAEGQSLPRDLLRHLAVAERKADRPDAADSALTELIRRHRSAWAMQEAARARLDAGQAKAALNELARARSIAYASEEIYLALADAELQAGKVREATVVLYVLHTFAPEVGDYLRRLGEAHLMTDNPEAARGALEKALSLDPNLDEAHLPLSDACEDLGDMECADKHRALHAAAQKAS